MRLLLMFTLAVLMPIAMSVRRCIFYVNIVQLQTNITRILSIKSILGYLQTEGICKCAAGMIRHAIAYSHCSSAPQIYLGGLQGLHLYLYPAGTQ